MYLPTIFITHKSSLTYILSFILHCLPTNLHLPLDIVFFKNIFTHRTHLHPTNLHLPPDIISRNVSFTHQNQLSKRLPVSIRLPMIADVHPWIIIYLHTQHVHPTNLHLPPDLISQKLLFTHQIQLSQRLPASF